MKNKIKNLSIILPAYNEAENISAMLDNVISAMNNHDIEYEIIVVNDKSTDTTINILNNLRRQIKNLRVLHHKVNKGYGGALRSGFDTAKYDWIFFTDADLQFDMKEISKLIKLAPKYDLVLGYRMKRHDRLYRLINAKLFALAVFIFFGLKVKDIDCAFKLFKRQVLEANPLESSGALINTELLVKAKRAGFKNVEVGVHHYPRMKGNPTGANIKVIVNALRDLLTFRLIGKCIYL